MKQRHCFLQRGFLAAARFVLVPLLGCLLLSMPSHAADEEHFRWQGGDSGVWDTNQAIWDVKNSSWAWPWNLTGTPLQAWRDNSASHAYFYAEDATGSDVTVTLGTDITAGSVGFYYDLLLPNGKATNYTLDSNNQSNLFAGKIMHTPSSGSTLTLRNIGVFTDEIQTDTADAGACNIIFDNMDLLPKATGQVNFRTPAGGNCSFEISGQTFFNSVRMSTTGAPDAPWEGGGPIINDGATWTLGNSRISLTSNGTDFGSIHFGAGSSMVLHNSSLVTLDVGSTLYVDLGGNLNQPLIAIVPDGSSLNLAPSGVDLVVSNAPGSFVFTLIQGAQLASGIRNIIDASTGNVFTGAWVEDHSGYTMLLYNPMTPPTPVPTPVPVVPYTTPNGRRAAGALAAMGSFLTFSENAELQGQLGDLTAEGAASQGFAALNASWQAARLGVELGLADIARPGMVPAAFSALHAMGRAGSFSGGFTLPNLADEKRGMSGLQLAAQGDRVNQSLAGLFYAAESTLQAQSLINAWQPAITHDLAARLNPAAHAPLSSAPAAPGLLKAGTAAPDALGALNAATAAGPNSFGLRFFGGYLGNFGHRSKDGGFAGYDSEMNGALFGLSWTLNKTWTIGAYGGFSEGETRYKGIRTEVDTSAAYGGAFARYSTPLREDLLFKITGDAAYSHFDNDSHRNLVFQGVERSLSGSYDQEVWSFGLDAELDWVPSFDAHSRISPFLSMRYAHLDQDGYRESGGLAQTGLGALVDLGLTVGSSEADFFNTVLGIAYARDFVFEKALLTPRVSVGWDHQYGDTKLRLGSNFNNQAYTYNVQSREEERDALQAGISLDALLRTDENAPSVGFKAAYAIEARDGGQDHTVYGGLEFRF